MHATGYLEQHKTYPLGLVATVAIHAAGLSALLLARNDYFPEIETILTVRQIPLPQPTAEPPPLPTDPAPRARPDTPARLVPSRTDAAEGVAPTPADPIAPLGAGGTGIMIDVPPFDLPVFTDAAVDPRYAGELQPPYPAGKQRLGEEGVVVVRVLIGVDGRVRRVEAVGAADDAFLAATERHALRRWRFRPATRDGVAIESWRTMTVRFEMTG